MSEALSLDHQSSVPAPDPQISRSGPRPLESAPPLPSERRSTGLGTSLIARPLWTLSVVGLGSGLAPPILDGLRSTADAQSFAWTSGIAAVFFALTMVALVAQREELAKLRGIGLGNAAAGMLTRGMRWLRAGAPAPAARAARVSVAARGLGVVALMVLVFANAITALTSIPMLFASSAPLSLAAVRLVFGLAAFVSVLALIAERLRGPQATLSVDDWYVQEPRE